MGDGLKGIGMNFKERFYVFLTFTLFCGFASIALAQPQAPVAKLAQVEGRVMVNTGTNYVMAASGTLLQPGTKVATTKGASVAIVYNDGCVKQVKENSILTVGQATECAAKRINERVYVAEAIGDTASDAPPVAAEGFAAAPNSNSNGLPIALWTGFAIEIPIILNRGGHGSRNASAE